MNRRDFLGKTLLGLGAIVVAPGTWSFEGPKSNKRSFAFRQYRPGKTSVPVQCVTPDDGFYLHTFYDVCPLSPSQRFLTVTKFPYQEKSPRWGDEAEICVIDLVENTIETVYSSKAWSYQLGANVQWGNKNDRYLYTNDVIDGVPVCIRIDLETREVRAYSGAKYDLSPDEKYVISPNLLTMNTHQYGYAVPDQVYGKVGRFTRSDMTKEGLWKTDLQSNKTELLASLADFEAHVQGAKEEREFYGQSTNYLFHSKINRQNTRIMQVFRGQIKNRGRGASLFSLNTDGSNIQQCLTKEHWVTGNAVEVGTNHPNWHPDGEHIVANCTPDWLGYKNVHFCQFKYDGSDFKVLSERHWGSGHPSINGDSSFLLSDTYPKEHWIPTPKGEVALRLLNLKTDEEQILCTVSVNVGNNGARKSKKEAGSQFKLDPHPAWSRDYGKVVFNGSPELRRQVFIADISSAI